MDSVSTALSPRQADPSPRRRSGARLTTIGVALVALVALAFVPLSTGTANAAQPFKNVMVKVGPSAQSFGVSIGNPIIYWKCYYTGYAPGWHTANVNAGIGQTVTVTEWNGGDCNTGYIKQTTAIVPEGDLTNVWIDVS
ncbi:hypothetical protein OG588_48285 [Streptomyces prunicolor]|uniref:hypothetical protein n=1 Tax=Streptomyces prunicolor TaxID=67348 RepID=UPI003868359E|nr:hypothetical protein OG588_48285 [Streptomyces prunicolor]